MDSSTTTDCDCRISLDFDILRHTEVFSGAPAEVIKIFAYMSRHRLYQPGEIILQQGQPADSCYFVINGEVDILNRHKGLDIVVQRISANSFFGELALLARFKWFFTAKARTETEILIIDRECFQKTLDKFPEKREKLTEKIIQLRVSRFANQTTYMLDRLVEAGLATGNDAKPLIG